MADKQVRLNLTLTAQDEARAVIESFARTLTETFDGLGTRLAESMNMAAVKNAISDTAKTAKSDLKSMTSSFSDLSSKSKSAGSDAKAGLNDVKTAVQDLKTPFTSDMTQMIDDIKRYESSIKDAASVTKSSSTEMESALKSLANAVNADMSTARTAISETTPTLDRLTQAAEGTKQALDFANLQMSGQMIKDTGDKIVAFFSDSAMKAANFDQNIKNVTASLNANLPSASQVAGMSLDDLKKKYDAAFDNGKIVMTTDAMQKLNDKALQLGSNGYFSAEQVAEAMNTLARQGISYNDIMSGAIDTVTNVAAANQQDIESTANVVSDIIHEMGESLTQEFGSDKTKQMAAVGDALTAALHHGRLSMNDFLNTMKYVGPQASAVGVSFTDLAASIALLAEHGIRGSQAGTGLRRELTNLLPQSKDAAKFMQQLGMTTSDVANIFIDSAGKIRSLTEVQQILHDKLSTLTPAMQQMAEKAIFGQYALASVATIAKTSPKEFQDLTKAMQKTGVTQDVLAEKSQGLGLQIQATKAHFETIRKEIGESLRPVIEHVITTLQSLMSAWQSLSPHTQKFILDVGLIVGVVATLGGGLLALIGTFGMLVMGLEAALPVLAAIGAGFGPVILVIAAVAAGVAALYYAWKNDFGGIQEHVKTFWAFVQQQFKAAINFLRPYVKSFTDDLSGFFQALGRAFELLVKVIMAAIDKLTPIWKSDWDVIKGILKAAFDVMQGVVRGAIEVITGIINLFVDVLTGNWKKAWDDVKQILQGVITAIEGILNGFLDFFKGVLNGAMDFLKGLGPKAYQWGVNMIQQLIDGIMSKIHAVETAVSTVASKITSFLGHHSPAEQGPMADDDTWMPNMMDMFTQGIVQHAPKIEAAISNVALGMKTSFTSPTSVTNNVMSVPHASGGQRAIYVNITVEGRSAKTDKDLAEHIASAFRTQMSIVSAR